MSPNQTSLLQPTEAAVLIGMQTNDFLTIRLLIHADVASSAFVKMRIWDFPGLFEFTDEEMEYLKQCNSIIYVIDAMVFANSIYTILSMCHVQDEAIDRWMEHLQSVIYKALQVHNKIQLDVFIHKCDQIPAASHAGLLCGASLCHPHTTYHIACKEDVSRRIAHGLQEGWLAASTVTTTDGTTNAPTVSHRPGDVTPQLFPSESLALGGAGAFAPSTYPLLGASEDPSARTRSTVLVAPPRVGTGAARPTGSVLERVTMCFHTTSIYDHTIFQALSEVGRRLVPQQAVLESLVAGFAVVCSLCHPVPPRPSAGAPRCVLIRDAVALPLFARLLRSTASSMSFISSTSSPRCCWLRPLVCSRTSTARATPTLSVRM